MKPLILIMIMKQVLKIIKFKIWQDKIKIIYIKLINFKEKYNIYKKIKILIMEMTLNSNYKN